MRFVKEEILQNTNYSADNTGKDSIGRKFPFSMHMLTKAAIIDSMTRTQHNRTRHSTNDFQLLMKNDICFHERSFLFDGLMGEQALLLEPWYLSSLTGV